MYLNEKPSHNDSLFMLACAGASALIAGGVFAMLMSRHGISNIPVYTQTVPLLLALGTFLTFFPFNLLISARNTLWMLGQGVIRWLRVLFLAMAALFFLPETGTNTEWLRVVLGEWALMTLPLQLLVLACTRSAIFLINNSSSNRRHAAFIGLGPEALKLALRLNRSPILGIRVLGYYAEEPVVTDDDDAFMPAYLGAYDQALRHVGRDRIDILFVGLGIEQTSPRAQELMNRVYDSTASIYFMPESPLLDEFAVSGADIAGVPLLALHETKMLGLSKSIKRGMDMTLGILGLLMVSPVMLGAALAIRLDSPGPIIFRQRRYGEGGRPITVYKFRSMRVQPKPTEGAVLKQAQVNDDRVTKIGRILRKTSLDELPQLFNVIQGTMSLVGPRPHAAEHNEFYRKQIRGYMLRHTVKPGITGWAQVNGLRGETDTPDKMQRRVSYDRYYIANWSFWLDVKILFRTVLLVFWDRHAY
jgi:putative colanic acid biosysnthesis UDP-glucose lipid carrier transferase